MAVHELADRMPVSRPAVSQHLRVLKDAGLVVDSRSGTRRRYQVDPEGVARLRAHFDRMWDRALGAFASAAKGKDNGRAQQRQIPFGDDNQKSKGNGSGGVRRV